MVVSLTQPISVRMKVSNYLKVIGKFLIHLAFNQCYLVTSLQLLQQSHLILLVDYFDEIKINSTKNLESIQYLVFNRLIQLLKFVTLNFADRILITIKKKDFLMKI